MLSPSRYSQPSMVIRRGWYSAMRVITGARSWAALWPSQARAECARVPWAVTRRRMVPWQPASTMPPDGSPNSAKSASSHSG